MDSGFSGLNLAPTPCSFVLHSILWTRKCSQLVNFINVYWLLILCILINNWIYHKRNVSLYVLGHSTSLLQRRLAKNVDFAHPKSRAKVLLANRKVVELRRSKKIQLETVFHVCLRYYAINTSLVTFHYSGRFNYK